MRSQCVQFYKENLLAQLANYSRGNLTLCKLCEHDCIQSFQVFHLLNDWCDILQKNIYLDLTCKFRTNFVFLTLKNKISLIFMNIILMLINCKERFVDLDTILFTNKQEHCYTRHGMKHAYYSKCQLLFSKYHLYYKKE